MKKYFKYLVCMAFLATTLWGCNRDKAEPELTTYGVEDNDLIQITNASPYIPLLLSMSDDTGLDKVEVVATSEGSNPKSFANTIKSITSKELGKFMVNVPFPIDAPSGRYTLQCTVTDKKGKVTVKSYKVSIVNSRAPSTSACKLPDPDVASTIDALPAGKNCWVYLQAPDYHDGSDVYIVGSFGAANGGSDWTPAQPVFKMEKLSNRCFRIALNLTTGSAMKFTLAGGWGSQIEKADGSDSQDIAWNGKAAQIFQVPSSTPDFAGFRGKLPPTSIPAGAIKTGMITVLIDVNSTDDSKPYYLVKKGATAVTNANKMLRMVGTRNMAIAVPKEANAEYIVVRETIAKVGQNAYGFDRSFIINGVTNPVNGGVSGFKTEFTAQAVPANLFAVGDATPGGWNNPVPTPSQQFSLVSTGKFEIASLAITAGKEMLLLPVNGSWDAKYGLPTSAAGPTTTGDVVPGGQNIKGPATAGNYKITVDFTLGTYTFTKL